MVTRYLLDTHVLVRWLAEPKKLSREQVRVLHQTVRRGEPVGISAVTLLEVAVLLSTGRLRIRAHIDEVLSEVEANPLIRTLPLTVEIAREVVHLGASLRDPADRAIVATARVHLLQLLTSDQRIIESKLVPAVE